MSVVFRLGTVRALKAPCLVAAFVCAATVILASCSDNRQYSGTVFVDSDPPPPRDADLDRAVDADLETEDGTGGEPVCQELDLPVIRVTPKVLVVLDRSNSMTMSGHWNPVREALVELTHDFDRRLAFGLMTFPEFEGSGACTRTSQACASPSSPVIGCAPGTAASIERVLSDLGTCGGTPIAETLEAAIDEFIDFDSPVRVPEMQAAGAYLLLATDGAPNCNENLDGETCRCTGTPAGCAETPLNCLDDARTLEAIERFAELDIQVFVLGIMASRWQDVLDEMSRRGGTERAYMIENQEAIAATFEEITRGLTTCEVAFRDPGPVADPALVNFYIDGVPVPLSDGDRCGWGWRWSDDRHRRVTFCGPFCEMLRDGEVDDVVATFGCPSLI